MAVIERDVLKDVRDRKSLFAFLENELHWAVESDDTFTYDISTLQGESTGRVDASQIVKFHEHDPFVILLAEFHRDFRRSMLREILKDLKRQMRQAGRFPGTELDDIILICTSRDYDEVRFAHFEEREGRQPALSVFGWDRHDTERTRTLREWNLHKLNYRPGMEPGEWRQQWLQAWDVAAVTRNFYETYERIFKSVEEQVEGPRTKEERRMFTQRLFNRLLFIQFLEKKGWLMFQGRNDYLPALFEQSLKKKENFYHDRLYWVFFDGLGRPGDIRSTRSDSELENIRGNVPYLNGGLFEMEEGDERGAVEIPNEAFDGILNDLFARYNFTITESAPDDVDVAVDPEMLGKVFEELVTGRHETGSYYTPRPIVAFMCREALKGYLGGKLASPGGESGEDQVSQLVDHHDAGGITVQEARRLLRRLEEIRVVDPACGSGAYLLGMLHELFTITRLLDTRADQYSARDDYARKLQIIQKNLYGVDIDPFAINIARLRLWLSLVVEYEGAEPEPLPNLDFKVEVGDSLIGPQFEDATQVDTRRDLIDQFVRAKGAYLQEHDHDRKHELRLEIDLLRDRIRQWTHVGQPVRGFDWQVEFAEVFAGGRGGFDVVLANPPYIRQEAILQQFGREYKDRFLKEAFPKLWSGTADIYVYFYVRAVELLREQGCLVFISSNKWFRADYGKKLRQHIAAHCRIQHITDFGDLPVFESATAYPMIFSAQKLRSPNQQPVFTQAKSLEAPYPDVRLVVAQAGSRLPADAIQGEKWTLTDAETIAMLRRMEADSVPLRKYVDGKIYRGVLTGFNKAFVIDGKTRAELIAEDERSAEIIKPLAVGKDICRWHIRNRDRWLIFVRHGTNIGRYPAIRSYLADFRGDLEPRPPGWDERKQGKWPGRKAGSYEWFEIQDSVAYHAAFEKPKIVYQEIATFQSFALAPGGLYLNNKVFLLPGQDLYLLGILNSSPSWQYLAGRCSLLQGGAYAMQTPYVSRTPVPVAAPTDCAPIEELVQKCLDAKGQDCEEWEREIDERVAHLYGVSLKQMEGALEGPAEEPG